MEKIENLIKKPIYIFTSDIDWASDPCIEIAHKLFLKYKIKPTYFITHKSKFLNEAKDKGEANLGIHPNFLRDSSHGSNYQEVVEYFDDFKKRLEPCFRSHRFYDVTDIKQILVSKGYKYDSNILTFMKKMMPFRDYSSLLRIPCSWEDGTHLNKQSLNFDKIKSFIDEPGLCVMNIHPLHMSINSPDMKFNRSLKNKLSRNEMINLSFKNIINYSFKGSGIKDFFESILNYITKKKYKILNLPEFYNLYLEYEKNLKIKYK